MSEVEDIITLSEDEYGNRLKFRMKNRDTIELWVFDQFGARVQVFVSKQEWEMVKARIDKRIEEQDQ